MNLLFYPNIAIPTEELKKYVLYAEKISSIVPNSIDFDEYSKDTRWNESISNMKHLEEIGIYEKTYTSSILYEHRESLVKEFMNRIADEEMFKEIKNNSTISNWWTLYTEKLDDRIIDFLIEEGLAEKAGNDLILVVSEVAAIYMGLLAEYASAYGDTFYSTVTNNYYYKELVYKPIKNSDRVLKAKFSIANILPVPTEETSIEEIVCLRKERIDELLRFQIFIREAQSDLNKINDVREYREAVEIYDKKIKLQVLDLTRLLKENNIRFALNTIDCFLPSNKIFSNLDKIGGDVFKMTSVVEKKIINKKALIRSNPISFILSAKTENIVNIE